MKIEKPVMELEEYAKSSIYKFLVNYITEHGYAPTVREICKGVGLTSTSTVLSYLEMLERMNKIKRDRNKPRAIRIVGIETIEKTMSDKLKKETCNECIENLQCILSVEQLKKFEKVFYSVVDKYIFKSR